MTPKNLLIKWIDLFNAADADGISELYSDDAINHQVALDQVSGKKSIKAMFRREFANASMVWILSYSK
jgi:ketosteroid isomerase-like protein